MNKSKKNKWEENCYIALPIFFIFLSLIFGAYIASSSVISKNFVSYQWKQFLAIPIAILLLIMILLLALIMFYLNKTIPNSTYIILLYLIVIILFRIFKVNMSSPYFFYLSFIILFWLYCSIEDKIKINLWILFTVIGILSLYIIGMYFIDAYTGEQKLNLPLNNCSNTAHQRLGEIKCKGLDGHVIVNEEVQCDIKSKYNISEGIVRFTFSNGTMLSKKLIKPIKFIIPKNMIRIYFKFDASDKKNNTICLDTASTIRYPTYSEFKENKIRFIKYMLSLFGFALLSIPLLVKTIKELSQS